MSESTTPASLSCALAISLSGQTNLKSYFSTQAHLLKFSISVPDRLVPRSRIFVTS
jgi:hypothetical protein